MDQEHALRGERRARRRALFPMNAQTSRGHGPPPSCAYTPEEHALWREILGALETEHAALACRRFLEARCRFPLLRDHLPQLALINHTLARETGFRMTPAVGYVEPPEFFQQLARAVFMATLYLRDPATPHFTPEPDYIHELVGHGLMLADATYASISHSFGRAASTMQAMGASPARLKRLERAYWYTMERFMSVRLRISGSFVIPMVIMWRMSGPCGSMVVRLNVAATTCTARIWGRMDSSIGAKELSPGRSTILPMGGH